MKTDTHPTYHQSVTVTCACGATHAIGSTLEELKVEICSACHPFYTGNEKVMDTAGRVDKFKKRMEQAAAAAPKKAAPAPEAKEEEEKTVIEETVDTVKETAEEVVETVKETVSDAVEVVKEAVAGSEEEEKKEEA